MYKLCNQKTTQNYIVGIVACLIIGGCSLLKSENSQELYAKAEALYEEGRKEDAKELYEKAADLGDANAHFALAYKFVQPNDEQMNHYISAAVQGHEKALYYALDELFFRAGDWAHANPSKALEVYAKAKKANPALVIYDEKRVVETIKRCIEAGRPQGSHFWKKYAEAENIPGTSWYFKIVEMAANTEFFGEKSSLLALQIVCNNSSIPAETQYAVEGLYKQWKKSENQHFEACEYATSREHTYSCLCDLGEKECEQATQDLYGRWEDTVE